MVDAIDLSHQFKLLRNELWNQDESVSRYADDTAHSVTATDLEFYEEPETHPKLNEGEVEDVGNQELISTTDDISEFVQRDSIKSRRCNKHDEKLEQKVRNCKRINIIPELDQRVADTLDSDYYAFKQTEESEVRNKRQRDH